MFVERASRSALWLWVVVHSHVEGADVDMLDDELPESIEGMGADQCDWCGEREVDAERLVPGFGLLRLCRECTLLLLSSITDAG